MWTYMAKAIYNITDNFAYSKGTVYMNNGTLSLTERVSFMNNQGSHYAFNTQVEFIMWTKCILMWK